MFEAMRQQVAASIVNQQPGSHATASQALNSNHQAVRDEVKGVLGEVKEEKQLCKLFINGCPRWAGLIIMWLQVRSLHGRNETAKVVLDTGVLPRKTVL